jgi:hypothetical protein
MGWGRTQTKWTEFEDRKNASVDHIPMQPLNEEICFNCGPIPPTKST